MAARRPAESEAEGQSPLKKQKIERSAAVFRSSRVLCLDGDAFELRPATVHVENGIVTRVGDYDDIGKDASVLQDFGDLVVMPGVVDTHVHINEPGRTEWEGFATATKAAAAGGVTTVIDMPLNSIPPTTTVANFHTKRDAASGQCWVDTGFWGGVIPGNAADLVPMVSEGVRGFKCFMVYSGVDEFPNVEDDDIAGALTALQGAPRDVPFMFHAEVRKVHAHHNPSVVYQDFVDAHPKTMEENAINTVIRLSKDLHPAVRCHIVHLSAASALPAIRAAKAAGTRLTVETCYHYLFFEAEGVPDKATQYKCCPPIRDSANREALWKALEEGLIDMVVSDHSPSTVALKKMEAGDFFHAWGGISSLQFGLSILWTVAHCRALPLSFLPKVLCKATAEHGGLWGHKGALAPGFDADIVVWDPDAEWTVSAAKAYHKNKITPYEGRTLKGVVHHTFVRGQKVFDAAMGPTLLPLGRLLVEPATA